MSQNDSVVNPLDRRTALAGAGVAAAALTLAAACSSDDSSSTSSSTTAKQADAPLTSTSDVPVGGGVIVGDTVVTQPTAGTYSGFSTTCTHAGCKVNKVVNGLIECPCHGSTFHLDGTVAHGPATRPLASHAVKVQGSNIVRA
ncbi:QcrA and Rieske domain-containing protein [Nocardia macrotermitis]|uniref:Cytochrome bc1 complex Rieske iron-sulfur subunit n=1 Tax=Nocardia macrotermitis TaxID=2585198 RepID=A0A7K0DD02_9NOCA|nr:Rieske (2Fe-2S) protein [Nocardia macrotermitis]MQY23202.1 Cytochrome b6-f complex iron-sulfur subunit [Nocardia macrotermitis]